MSRIQTGALTKEQNYKSYLQGGRIIKDTDGCLDQNIPSPTYRVDGPSRTPMGALTKEKISSPTYRVDKSSRTPTGALSKIFQVLPIEWKNP